MLARVTGNHEDPDRLSFRVNRAYGEDTMKLPVQGGCACGEIRYECAGEPVFVLNCHCRDCQQATGSPMVTNIFVKKPDFKLLRGTPKSREITADSGNKIERFFCGSCGSPLFTDPKGYPDFWGIRAVSLDDPSPIQPGMNIWTGSAQPWDHISDELPSFPKNPPV